MVSINLDSIEQMEISHNTDWLDVGKTALACSMTISPDRTKLAKQTPATNHYDDSDLTPFDPNFQSTDPQTIISNLPQLKECEFDHNYILHHLKELEIDPTLVQNAP